MDKSSVRQFEMRSFSHDVRAQFRLAKMYEVGAGVKENVREAIRIYTLLADQGNADVQYYLSWLYYRGDVVEENIELAVRYCILAAENGMPLAQYGLAALYSKGEGVQKNIEEAIRLCILAMNQGVTDAEDMLLGLYKEKPIDRSAVGYDIGTLGRHSVVREIKTNNSNVLVVNVFDKKTGKQTRILKKIKNYESLLCELYVLGRLAKVCAPIGHLHYFEPKKIGPDLFDMGLAAPFTLQGFCAQYEDKKILMPDIKLDFHLQIKEAVAHLHKNKVVHGDIHVGNVVVYVDETRELIDSRFMIKLIDFGASPLDITRNNVSWGGAWCGLPPYVQKRVSPNGIEAYYEDINNRQVDCTKSNSKVVDPATVYKLLDICSTCITILNLLMYPQNKKIFSGDEFYGAISEFVKSSSRINRWRNELGYSDLTDYPQILLRAIGTVRKSLEAHDRHLLKFNLFRARLRSDENSAEGFFDKVILKSR